MKFNWYKQGIPVFWSTNDIKFKTPEGYSVGTLFKDISLLERKKMYREAGFGYFIKLKSGWQLGFCEGDGCTENKPTDNSVVKWMMNK